MYIHEMTCNFDGVRRDRSSRYHIILDDDRVREANTSYRRPGLLKPSTPDKHQHQCLPVPTRDTRLQEHASTCLNQSVVNEPRARPEMARQGSVVEATPRRSKRQRQEEPSAEKPRRASEGVSAGENAAADAVDPAGELLDRETVLQAATALLAHRAAHVAKAGDTTNMLDASEDMVSVVVSLKRAPRQASMIPRIIELAHPLYKAGEDDVCFFVKDPQREVKDLLAREGVASVTKVLAVSKLEKRYGTHEGKRELAQLYDLFLVDDRVVKFMPRLLGNVFVKGKKMPLTVRMGRDKDVVKGIDRALKSTSFQLSRGTTVNVRVARASFTAAEIADNVERAVQNVAATLPGAFGAIQALFIKTSASPSLPVHFSAPEAKDFAPSKEEANAKWEADRLQRKRERARLAVTVKEEKLKARSAAKKEKKDAKREEKFKAAATQKEAKREAKKSGLADEDGEDSDEIAEAILESFAAGEAEFELSDDGSDDSGEDSDGDAESGEVAAPLPMPTVPAKRNRAQRRKETSDRPLVRSVKEAAGKLERSEPAAKKQVSKGEGKPAPKKKAKTNPDADTEKKSNGNAVTAETPKSEKVPVETPGKTPKKKAKQSADPTPEKTPKKKAKQSADPTPDKTPKKKAKQIADPTPDKTPKKKAKQSADPTPDKTPKKKAKQSADPTPVETPQASVQKKSKKTTGTPSEKTPKVSVQVASKKKTPKAASQKKAEKDTDAMVTEEVPDSDMADVSSGKKSRRNKKKQSA